MIELVHDASAAPAVTAGIEARRAAYAASVVVAAFSMKDWLQFQHYMWNAWQNRHGYDTELGSHVEHVFTSYCSAAFQLRRIALSDVQPDYGYDDLFYLREETTWRELHIDQTREGLEACVGWGLLSGGSPGKYSLPLDLLAGAVALYRQEA